MGTGTTGPFGIEENSAWLGHNGMIPGYMTYVVYDPALDASIVLVQNSDKNTGKEPGINPATSRYQQDPLPSRISGEASARRRLKSAEMTW